MNDLLRIAVGFLDDPTTREKVLTMAEAAFDKYVEPIDLPGPDAVIDPLIRAAIGPTVGAVYDGLLKELKERINA